MRPKREAFFTSIYNPNFLMAHGLFLPLLPLRRVVRAFSAIGLTILKINSITCMAIWLKETIMKLSKGSIRPGQQTRWLEKATQSAGCRMGSCRVDVIRFV